MKRFWFRRGLRFLAFGILFIGLVGLLVMNLWNALLPPIMGVTTITFGQALGLLVLSRLLFGGFGWGRFAGHRGYGRRGHGRREYGRGEWKQKMSERWQQMTPEQREQMKQKWRSRCGPGRRGDSRSGQGGPTESTPGPTNV